MRKLLLIVFGLALLGIVARVVYLSRDMPSIREGQNHREAVQKLFDSYSQAMVGGDLHRAFNFCSPDFKKATPFETFSRQQSWLESRNGKLMKIEFIGMELRWTGQTTKWLGVITADSQYAHKTIPFIYVVKLENNRWAITHYEPK